MVQENSDKFPVIFVQKDKFKILITITKIFFVYVTEVTGKGLSHERFGKVRVSLFSCSICYGDGLCYLVIFRIKGDIFKEPCLLQLERQLFFYFCDAQFFFECHVRDFSTLGLGSNPDSDAQQIKWIGLDDLASSDFYPKAIIPYLQDLSTLKETLVLGDVN